MFLQNKYTKRYFGIIEKAKSEGRLKLERSNNEYVYFEEHHITPRALGGGNEIYNLVLLTAKEHFICHLLLVYMLERGTDNWKKMLVAFSIMNQRKTINSKLYSNLREEYSKINRNKWIVFTLDYEDFLIEDLPAYCRKMDIPYKKLLSYSHQGIIFNGILCCNADNMDKIKFLSTRRDDYSTTTHIERLRRHKRKAGWNIKSDVSGVRFTIYSPNGEKHNVENVADFCRTHNLNPSAFYRVIRGEISYYKGFNLTGNPPTDRMMIRSKISEVSSKERFTTQTNWILYKGNTQVSFTNIKNFAKENSMSREMVRKLLKNEVIEYRGFRSPCSFF